MLRHVLRYPTLLTLTMAGLSSLSPILKPFLNSTSTVPSGTCSYVTTHTDTPLAFLLHLSITTALYFATGKVDRGSA